MAYPYSHGVRPKRQEIHSARGQVDVHDITPTGGSVDFNLPRGAYSIQISLWGVDNDQAATFTIAPYVDDAQTIVAGDNNFLEIGEITVTASITVAAATATAVGYQAMVVQAGDQYAASAPNMSLAGARMTIATTATTGILHYSYVAVEW